MVVAQLVEQSLLTPEIRSLNPDTGKIWSTNSTIEKTKIKKRGREWPIFKKVYGKVRPPPIQYVVGQASDLAGVRVGAVQLLPAEVADEALLVEDEALPGRDDPLQFVDLALAVDTLLVVGVNSPGSVLFQMVE